VLHSDNLCYHEAKFVHHGRDFCDKKDSLQENKPQRLTARAPLLRVLRFPSPETPAILRPAAAIPVPQAPFPIPNRRWLLEQLPEVISEMNPGWGSP
jgi:hypothetical protein